MSQFDILIVGGGLVGLATAIGLRKKGHNVRVVEAAPNLQLTGDAIAISANHQRVLKHYDILETFHAHAAKNVGCMYHRSFGSGEIISTRDMKAQEADYGYASYILSRAGYQDFLYQEAKRLGAEFLFGHRIESVEDNTTRPAVKFQDGSMLEADIIVGADGIKSKTRTAVSSDVRLTVLWDCYRAVIDRKQLENDPELLPYLQGIHFNMGTNLLVVVLNLVDTGHISLNMYCQGDTGSIGSWRAPADPNHIRSIFKDCSPALQKILGFVDNSLVWKVVQVSPLDSWVSNNGKVVLIGDACHAMTPHQGQGCSAGVEDSGVLAECISRAKTIEDIPSVLKKYESLRKPRTELIQSVSASLGRLWTVPDEEQQRQRNENMRKTPIHHAGGWDGTPIDTVPSGLGDPTYFPWLMGHDAVDFARRQLDATT